MSIPLYRQLAHFRKWLSLKERARLLLIDENRRTTPTPPDLWKDMQRVVLRRNSYATCNDPVKKSELKARLQEAEKEYQKKVNRNYEPTQQQIDDLMEEYFKDQAVKRLGCVL